MHPIERKTNWCEIDILNGIEIKNNERLRVKFPNDEILEITVLVVSDFYDISDMGHPYRIPCRKAYLATKWKGQPCRVPLFGLEAERISNENSIS